MLYCSYDEYLQYWISSKLNVVIIMSVFYVLFSFTLFIIYFNNNIYRINPEQIRDIYPLLTRILFLSLLFV